VIWTPLISNFMLVVNSNLSPDIKYFGSKCSQYDMVNCINVVRSPHFEFHVGADFEFPSDNRVFWAKRPPM